MDESRSDKGLEFCKSDIHVIAYSPLGSSKGGKDLIFELIVERNCQEIHLRFVWINFNDE